MDRDYEPHVLGDGTIKGEYGETDFQLVLRGEHVTLEYRTGPSRHVAGHGRWQPCAVWHEDDQEGIAAIFEGTVRTVEEVQR